MKKQLSEKIVILIPYFNAQNYLPELIDKILTIIPEINIVLVNDGSTNNSENINNEILKNKHIHIIQHPQNLGKGASIKTGIKFISENISCDSIITLDADGQHPAHRIPEFIEQHNMYPQDLIIGSRRFHPAKMPIPRIISNSLSSRLLSWKLKQKIEDSQCGFRLIPKNLWEIALKCKENGFQFETEFLINTVKNGNSIKFSPIETIYNGSPSAIKKTNDIITFIKLYFSNLI